MHTIHTCGMLIIKPFEHAIMYDLISIWYEKLSEDILYTFKGCLVNVLSLK